MGIPVCIYEEETVLVQNPTADQASVEPSGSGGGGSVVSFPASNWSLHRRREFCDAQWASMRESKGCDGKLWVLWMEDGTRVCIVDEQGRPHEYSVRLPARITALDAVDTRTVLFGLASGQHGRLDLITGEARYGSATAAPVAYVWYRSQPAWATASIGRHGGSHGGINHVTLARDTTLNMSGHVTRKSRADVEVTCADLNQDATWVAFSDGARVWMQHTLDSQQLTVPGVGLDSDEQVVSLRFAPNSNMLAVATTQRIVAYECGAACVALVCCARNGTVYDFDMQGALVVEQQHLYGTHVAHFVRVNGGPQWAQMGYSDVRAQFGIRKVHKIRASCVGVCIVAEAGMCSEFATDGTSSIRYNM